MTALDRWFNVLTNITLSSSFFWESIDHIFVISKTYPPLV